MKIRTYRRENNLTLQEMAERIGLSSKGRMSRIERGVERCPTDIAIRIDRLTAGEVSVSDLRPDLDDIRVVSDRAAA